VKIEAILGSYTDEEEQARGRIAPGWDAIADGGENREIKKFGEEHLDVLQNIEFGIIEVYRADPALLDFDAKDAMDALVRCYHAEEERRTPPKMNLGERAQRVFESVQRMCEWRLGRSPAPGETAMLGSGISISELVSCLREIQRSIPRWSKQGGRKGYLDFVSQYLP
jgi:hypothetical protein